MPIRLCPCGSGNQRHELKDARGGAMKVILAISVLANVLLFISLQEKVDTYGRLLEWACGHGNGGHECGEE